MAMIATPTDRRRLSDRWRRWFVRICWGYAAISAGATALLWFTGDRWSGGTILCFVPRWPLAVPGPILVVLGLKSWRITLLPLTIAAVATAFWLAIVIPWGKVDPSGQLPFRVITFNTQGSHGDLSAFSCWALEQRADVIFLQEADGERLKQRLGPDWHWSSPAGGVILASRHPIIDVAVMERPAEVDRLDCLCVDLKVENYVVRVGVVHLPTPREGLEALVHRNRRFLEIMATERQIRQTASNAASDFLLRRLGVDIVAGDFNMPVESGIYKEYWGETTNAFSVAGWGRGHTKFTRWHGVRIDHILIANPGVGAIQAYVGPDVGSDHRPVFAELALPMRKSRD
jgi:vancomycin resistance protein VanJ